MKTLESIRELYEFEARLNAWRRSLLARLKKEEPKTKELLSLISGLEESLK